MGLVTRALSLLVAVSGWSATRTASTASAAPLLTAFRAPPTTTQRHAGGGGLAQHLAARTRTQQGRGRGRRFARGTAAAARERTSLVCQKGASPAEGEHRGARDATAEVGKTSSTDGGGFLAGIGLAGACSAVVLLPAGACWAEAIVGDAGGGEMGARLDAPAAISFGAVVVAFSFLQARIRAAVRARTARRDYEMLFKGMKAKQLAGQADEEDVALVEERMSQLLREEREARMVDIFGIPFNLVIPDGGAGGEQGTGAREAQQGRSGPDTSGAAGSQQQRQQLGIREAKKAKAESDMRDGRAREEEMSTGATLKVAALWLVLISQLWLLLVLWNDPMGPASSAFLKD